MRKNSKKNGQLISRRMRRAINQWRNRNFEFKSKNDIISRLNRLGFNVISQYGREHESKLSNPLEYDLDKVWKDDIYMFNEDLTAFLYFSTETSENDFKSSDIRLYMQFHFDNLKSNQTFNKRIIDENRINLALSKYSKFSVKNSDNSYSYRFEVNISKFINLYSLILSLNLEYPKIWTRTGMYVDTINSEKIFYGKRISQRDYAEDKLLNLLPLDYLKIIYGAPYLICLESIGQIP